jgi:hypothetical protein
MLKKILFGLVLTIGILLAGSYFMLSPNFSGAHDVTALCQLPPGLSLEEVLTKAKNAGFSEEKQGALGFGIQVLVPGENLPVQGSVEVLHSFQSGEVKFGKVIVKPFLRHYCAMEFNKRTLVSTEKIILD